MWFKKNPDLTNNPLYLEPRVTAAETSLAQKVSSTNITNLRDNSGTFEYSMDNTTWKQIQGESMYIDVTNPPNGLTPAKGDGITDDTQAFIDAFNYAKGKNVKVVATKTNYYLSNTQTINVYNDADFGGAVFTIDDTNGYNSHLFSILHDNDSYQLDTTTLNAIKTKFVKTTTKITELAGLGNIIVYIYDNTKKMYIREGANANTGDDKFDQVTIDNQGYLTSQLTWDFDNVTSITIQKMDDKFIKFGNAVFLSSNNVPVATATYINKGINVKRSNVILSKISHRVTSEGDNIASRNGFLFPQYCANVIFDSINLQPLKKQSEGTYEIGGTRVINLKINNLNAQSYNSADRWGVMGTNYLKNVTIKDSKMSRIDCHSGVHNLTIDNCELGSSGLTVVGFGDLIINDSKFYSNGVVNLRSDYGAFWNGNIYGKNIYHKPIDSNGTSFVNATYKYDWNYGYPLMMGTGIIALENYEVDNITGEFSPKLFKVVNTSGYDGTEVSLYKMASTLSVKNAKVINKQSTTQGFTAFYFSDVSKVHAQENTTIYADGAFTPNIDITLDNVDFAGASSAVDTFSDFFSSLTSLGFDGSDTYSSVLDRLFFKFNVVNAKRLFANLRGMYAYLNIDKSTVRTLRCNNNGCRSIIRMNNTTIRPLASSFGDVIIQAKKENLFFSNCFFTKSYYTADTVVNTNYLGTNYDFLKIGTVGTTAAIEANLSACVFDPTFDFKTLRSDIELTDFRFGNNHYAQRFPLRKGTTSQRPVSTDIRASFMYFDTDLNKPIWFDGTNWKDSTGTVV